MFFALLRWRHETRHPFEEPKIVLSVGVWNCGLRILRFTLYALRLLSLLPLHPWPKILNAVLALAIVVVVPSATRHDITVTCTSLICKLVTCRNFRDVASSRGLILSTSCLPSSNWYLCTTTLQTNATNVIKQSFQILHVPATFGATSKK